MVRLVWIQVYVLSLFFFFFFASAIVIDQVSSGQYTCALFMGLTNFTFQQLFFIKNRSHGTIHTFKNYFATVFSIFSFSKISSIQTDLRTINNMDVALLIKTCLASPQLSKPPKPQPYTSGGSRIFFLGGQ